MGTYKTAPLVDYDVSFQDVAERLFDLASNRLAHGVGVPEKGSYSFRPTDRLKILIFQRAFGIQMQGALPWLNDGVYVLVRTNGVFGDRIWQDPPAMDSKFSARMNRDEHVGTAPNDARFAHFPLMAGENTDAVAEFIAWVVERASA